MKLPLILDDIKNKKEYNTEQTFDKYILNCHIGHRKLLCADLLFLIECQKKIDLNDCLIIYIGAAPFISYNVIDGLYPNISWIVYDKNKFIFDKEYKNIKIRNKYFKDEDITVIKDDFKQSNKKYLLYINDMRLEPDEISILNDMINQQLWLLKIDPYASCIKFKLPYYIKDKMDLNYELPSFIKSEKKKSIYDMLYLDGKVYLQTYAPKRSIETRLISFKPYKLVNYNIIDYEQKLNYFNEKIRTKEYIYKDSKKFLFLNLYDNVNEFYIFKNYNDINKKFNNMFEMYNFVDNVLNKYNIYNGINCKLKSFKYSIYLILTSNLKKDNKQKKYLKIIKDMKEIINKINKVGKTKDKNYYKNFKLDIDFKYIIIQNKKLELKKDYIKEIYDKI